jgi:hypothetical protein
VNWRTRYYQQEIKKRRRTNQAIKEPEQIEKYAREKYYMKRTAGYLHHRI